MEEDDLKAVLEIERASNPVPWSEKNFLDCLKKDYYCLIQEYQGKFSGFSITSFSLDEAHLLNIGVASRFRKRGLGTTSISLKPISNNNLNILSFLSSPIGSINA